MAPSLNSGAILTSIAASLPASKPEIKDAYAAIALFYHVCMLEVGFRLIGLGDEGSHNIEHTSSESDEAKRLPEHWARDSTITFRYAHSQSSMTFLLKINRLGPKAVILAMALGDDRTSTFDVSVRDFVSGGALPVTLDEGEGGGKLKDVFISEARMRDLESLLRINVIQKLAPGLQKEGYEAQSNDREERVAHEAPRDRDPARNDAEDGRHDPLRDYNAPRPALPRPHDDPLAIGPRRGGPVPDFAPPGFEDEYEIGRPGRLPQGGAARRPLNIGERDLYPAGLGPRDPLRPGLGGFGAGGGMHPTFDDPMFGGGGTGGLGGGGGYDPHAPPGARYDPVGPGGQPRDFGGRGGFPGGGSGRRGFGGGGGSGGNPFGGYGSGDFI